MMAGLLAASTHFFPANHMPWVVLHERLIFPPVADAMSTRKLLEDLVSAIGSGSAYS